MLKDECGFTEHRAAITPLTVGGPMLRCRRQKVELVSRAKRSRNGVGEFGRSGRKNPVFHALNVSSWM
jgi:hypothetical protein